MIALVLEDERDPPPLGPKFKKRSIADALVAPSHFTVPNLFDRMHTIPARGNVSSPIYRKGSTIIEYRIDKLLHGVFEDSGEPFALRIETDGDYTVDWEVHAENLQEAVDGELKLQVVTKTEEGEPIRSLDELLPQKDTDNE